MMIKTADYKVTALFCVIDDFCKHFEAENAGKLLLGEVGTKRRRRKASLSDSEIIPQFGIRNLAQTFVGLLIRAQGFSPSICDMDGHDEQTYPC